MPNLDYGYTITIAKDATSIPSQQPVNQWQRKPSGSTWSDISGETGDTYTVTQADRSCEIRLRQYLGESPTFSNTLVVTSDQGCPTLTQMPALSPSAASNNTSVELWRHIAWSFTTPPSTRWQWECCSDHTVTENSRWTVVQNGGNRHTVSSSEAQNYNFLRVSESITNAPVGCVASGTSNIVALTYAKTWGSVTISGPSSGKTYDRLNYTVAWTGDVSSYTPAFFVPYGVTVSSQNKSTEKKFTFTLTYNTPQYEKFFVTMTSNHSATAGTNPVNLEQLVNVVAPPPVYTLGTVTIDGPYVVEADEYTDYEIKWTGNAPASAVTHQWITDGQVENASLIKTRAKWAAGTGHFLWAQVSYNGEVQMPKHEPITANAVAPPFDPTDVVISVQGVGDGVDPTNGDVLYIKEPASLSELTVTDTRNQWQKNTGSGGWVDIPQETGSTYTVTGDYCNSAENGALLRLRQKIFFAGGSSAFSNSNEVRQTFPKTTSGPANPPTYGYPTTTSLTVPAKMKVVAAYDCTAVGIGTSNILMVDTGAGFEQVASGTSNLPTSSTFVPKHILWADGWWYLFYENGYVYRSRQPKSIWEQAGTQLAGVTKVGAIGYKSRVRMWVLQNNKWEAYGQTPGSSTWSKQSVSGRSFSDTNSTPVAFQQQGTTSKVYATGGKTAMITSSSTSWAQNAGMESDIPSYYEMGWSVYSCRKYWQLFTNSRDIYASDDGGANFFLMGQMPTDNRTQWMMGNDEITWELGSNLYFALYDENPAKFQKIDSPGRYFTGGCWQPAKSRWIFVNDTTQAQIWGG